MGCFDYQKGIELNMHCSWYVKNTEADQCSSELPIFLYGDQKEDGLFYCSGIFLQVLFGVTQHNFFWVNVDYIFS